MIKGRVLLNSVGSRGVLGMILLATATVACGTVDDTGSPLPSSAASTQAAGGPESQSGQDVVEAFFSYASDDALTMNVVYDGTTEIVADDRSARETFRITGEMDAAGRDFAGTISISSEDESRTVEVVRVGDESYVRPENGAWQVVDDEGSQPVNPFAGLESAAEVEYIGEAEWQGQSMYQLRTSKWLGDDPASMESATLTDVELISHSFDIFVTADGVPVGGELTAELTGSVNGTPATITNSYTYTFEDVGDPVTIEAPVPDS